MPEGLLSTDSAHVFVGPGPAPEAVGGFRVVAPLEASALGRAFRAVRETDGKSVLLRLVERDDAALKQRVRIALAALQEIDHPNLSRVVAFGESAGLEYYALEIPECVMLVDFVRRGRPLDGSETAWAGRQLASALDALHERCLPHGDVTPVSVAICCDGTVKLVDLGWAPRIRDPEFGSQLAETVAQDLAQLGATLVFGTTGQAPKSKGVSGRHGRPTESSGSGRSSRPLAERAAWLTPAISGTLEALMDEEPSSRPSAHETERRLRDASREVGLRAAEAPPDLVETVRHLTGMRSAGSDKTTAGAATPGVIQPPQLGAFGRYVLLEEVARGGMGVVYRARHAELDRIFALKVLLSGDLSNDVARRRFFREAEAAAQLDHPSIVRVHDFGEHDGRAYIAMDFAEGQSLSSLLTDPGQRFERLLGLFAKTADAVHYAHSRGIIHRDLKPQNVIVDKADVPHILDFGVAKRLEEVRAGAGLTTEGELVGTPAYMPPEQAEGRAKDIDTRSDVYALGVMLFEIATRGRLPFEGLTVTDVLTKVLLDDPPPPSRYRAGLPWEIDAITVKAIEKDPRKRYQSAAELGRDIRNFLEGVPISAKPANAVYRARKWIKRNRRILPFVVVALVASAATPILMVRADAENRRKEREKFEGLLAQGQAAVKSAGDAEKLREALNAFGAALAIEPASREAVAGYTRAELELKRFEEERERLRREQALEKYRKDEADLLARKGDEFLRGGDAEHAKEEFFKALGVDPRNEAARKGLVAADQAEFARKREAEQRKQHERDLAESRRLVGEGRSALERGETESARRAFFQALGFDNTNVDAQEGLRGTYSLDEKQKKDQALARANELVASGRVHMGSKEYALARQEFVQALVFDGSNQDALRGLSQLDLIERDLAWEAERRRKRSEADALIEKGRSGVQQARALVKEGADRVAIRTAYYTAIEAFDRASFLQPDDKVPAAEKSSAARELAVLAKNQQDWGLSEYLFRIAGTSAEAAEYLPGATELNDCMVVIEASATNLQNAFREPLDFEERETREYLAPVRELVEPKKDKYRLRIEIRSKVSPGAVVSVTGITIKLDDLARNVTSAPEVIDFPGEGYRRIVVAGTSGRIVPSLKKSVGNDAADLLTKIKDRTTKLIEAAEKKP